MLKKVLSSVGVIFSFFLFAACEVGLGEKVDVIAPVLEIGTPEDGSVIMNTFTMTGSAGDDSFVALININVTSTTTGATVANYTGGMDIFRSAWSCTVNNRHVAEDGTVSYDIPDGEYTFTVTATDKVGRQTSKSRMYKIDNTAPIVVIKRPDTDDSFGKTIRVTGDIADANTLSSLYFTAYKKNSEGILEKIDTVRHANISGVGLDLIIAKKYDNPSSESEKRLTELYNKLYDTRDAGQDTAKIYCVIEVADSAKEYGAPSSVAKSGGGGTYSESGFTPMGNLSSCYYIYDTIYNKIYSESADDSFKLTNADLVSVANGSYSKSDNVAEIKQYLSENSIKTENSGIESGLSADKISSFKLNPANSPYFEVSGYKFENEFSSISNESKITVSVSQGRDQISLKENTIRLVLKECDEHGSVAEGTKEIVLVESLDNIEKIEDAEERAKALAVREKAISFGDSIKIVTSIGKLNAKKYYVVSAEGCDLDGNEIENSDGNIYGFLVETVSKPPVITVVSGPADLCVMNNYNFSFAGTVKHWTDSVYLSCAVTAANEKNPDEEEHSYAADVNLNGDEWSIEITDEKFADLLSNSLYLCSVSITAVDSDQNSSSVTRRIHVDTDKPSMSTLSVSPYYSIDTTTKIPTVNGKISLSANVTDNYELYETNYDIYYLSGETRQSIQAGRLTDFSIEIKDLNTVVANLPVYDLTAEFVIADKAGNTNTVIQAIHVDQETDRPGISFSNLEKGKDISELTAAVNLFDKGNNKILGTVTDDDNVYSIKFNARKLKDDGSWDDSVEFYSVSGLNTSSYTLSIPLQIKNGNTAETFAEGIYKIDYEVWDKDGNASNGAVSCTNGSDLYHIGVDYAAPSLSIYTESGDFKGKNKGFKIKGSVTEGNKTVTVKVEGDNEALTLPVAAPAGAGWELQSVTSEESGSLSDAEYYKKGNWEFKVTDADAGKYEFVYITDSGDSGRNLIFTATDKFAKSSSQEFSYIIDSMPPYIFVDSSISEPIYVGTTLNPYASFKGTAEDPGDMLSSSGVAAVEYSVSDSAAFSSWTAAEGTLKWSANINFEELAKSYFDSNIDKNSYSTKIKFRAKDNSGLTGDTDSSAVAALRTIIVDRKAPVITAGAISGDVCLIDSTYYARGTFTLKVNVSDDNLDSIKCSDSSIAMPAISGTGGEYEISIPASTAGSKTYTFTAVDKAKQSTSLSVNVYVDKTAPVPSVELQDYYKFESSLYTVNGIVKIKGNASDNDKVLKTEIKIYKDGETEPVYVSSDSDIPEATMFSIEKNSYTDFTDNTEYSIVVNSTDRAGNTGSKTIRFKVDQETDKPVITFSNLEKGKDISELTTGVNLFDKGNNKILGTVTDDDNIYSIKFSGRKLKDDGTWDDPFEFYSVDGLSTSSYELSIPLQTGTFAEGIYKIDYEIWDKDGDPSNYAVSRTSGSDIYNIGVDYAAPTITVSTASGQFKVENTNFKIKGSVTEGNKIVTIKAEGDAVELSLPVSDLASNGWTLQNDTSEDSASLSDAGYYKKGNWEFKVTDADSGKYDFIYIKNSGTAGNNVKFTVTDRFAKTNLQEFSYVVDSYDPYVSVDSSIAEYVYVGTSLNPYASFKGNAEDPGDSLNSSGIAAVEYSVSDSDTFTSWTTAEGTLKWSANINFEELTSDYFAAHTDKNSYTLKIKFRAKDNAGRTGETNSSSVEAVRTVIVDRKAPVIELKEITDISGKQLSYIGSDESKTYYTSGGFKVAGIVREENLKGLSLGGTTITTTSFNSATNESEFTYEVQNPASERTNCNFTATDKANQSNTIQNVVIVKDSVAPMISGVNLSDSYEKAAGVYYVKSGTYTLGGSSTDNFALKETVVKLKKGSEEKSSSTLTDSSWTVNLDFSDSTEWSNGSAATVEITAYDVAGNASAVTSITVKFDTEKPVLNSFLNWKNKDMLFLINSGKYKDGTFGKSLMMEIEGCYNESGSGINAVYYQVIPTGSSKVPMSSAAGADGKFEANSTKEFTIKENESDTASTVEYPNAFKVNLSGFKESTVSSSNKLRLIAIDNVGNVSEVEEKTLNVDTTAPAFNQVVSVEKLTNTEAAVTISGSNYFVSDSGAGFILGSENEDPTEGPVTATIDGEPVTGSVGTVTNVITATTEYPDASSKKAYYSVTINQTYLAGLSSGNYIIKVTAKDAANDGDGNESYTNIATVVIDKDAPKLDIVNVTPKVGDKVNGKVKVSGSASDGNALKSVTLYTSAKASGSGDVDVITYTSASYYKIDQDSSSTAYNWSATIDTTKYTDNSTVKLLAVAEDEAGNKTYKTEDLNIDQSTDIPTVSFSNMKVSGTAKENLFGLGSTTIYASASDDDGIAKIEYSIDDNASYTVYYTKGSEIASVSKSISIDLSTLTPVLSSGEHKIKFKVIDINETPIIYEGSSLNDGIVNFGYDTKLPTIMVSTVGGSTYTSGMFAAENFAVVGTATDDYQVESVYLLSGTTTTGENLYSSADGTWTDNVTNQTDTAAGATAARTYQVTDKFGRTSTVDITYQVDTNSPVFNAYETTDYKNGSHIVVSGGTKNFVDNSESDNYFGKVDNEIDRNPVNWFNQSQLTINGTITENHLKSVTLKHGSNESAQINPIFAFSESFENGQNDFILTALDEAGNSASIGSYSLYVDTNVPTVSVEPKNSDGTTAFENGTVLGASGVIKFNITASDDPVASEKTSGISKVYIGTSVSVDSNSKIAEITKAELDAASNVFTFTVGNYSSLADGSYTLYVRAEDVAGNLSTGVTAATFVVDKTAPKVSITSPVAGKTVDKKITISGTVQDANLDIASALPELWIKEKTSGSWAKASDASVSAKTYSDGEWSLKFDTEKYTDEKDYYIAVVFTDKAGNSTDHTSSTHTIHVSQDNDRPVVIFSNVELESTMSSSSRKMIKNNQITGTVTDADGAISAVYIQVIDKDANLSDTDSAWGESIFDSSSSLWSYTFPSNGSLDGEKDIYFKVVDAEETAFVSAVAAKYLSSPKLQYKTVKFAASNQSTILYASVDMINPEIKRFAFTTADAQTIAKEKLDGASDDYSYTLSIISDADFEKLVEAAGTDNSDLTGWTDISVAPVFGGSSKSVYLLACGYDTTSIESLELKVASSDVTAVKTKKDSSGKYIYALYKLDFSTSAYLNKYQKLDMQLLVYDTATRQNSRSKNITVDNKAPTVEIKSPNSDGNYFYGTGSNSIMGAADDDSSVQSIYLGFSKNATDAPSSYTDILASRDGTSASSLSASSWIINFDDRISGVTDYSHMELFNSFVKTAWEYGEIPSNVTEKPLYIWAYAKDSLGNSGTPASIRYINVYTQGDIPSIDEVSYPDANGKVGGTVRVTGSASISDTSVAIEDILIQVDLSYETEFNEAWEDELTALINAAGDLKSTLETEYLISEVELGDGTKIRGVKASGTNSWNLPINKYKEFNLKDSEGKDKNRDMAIRVYAVNNSATYKKAGKPVVVPFTLDPGSPVFGNKEPLKLVQYNNNDARTGGVKASRLYTDNMWISGKWWLEGSIEDDSGIKQITVSKNGGTVGNIDASYIADTTEPAGESYKNKTLMMPVGTDEEDKFGTEIYEITAYEGAEDNKSTPITITLNYDNKAPVFDCTTLESGKTNSIVQSDGTYEIKGTLKEDSSASANQSGFERIAFSFTKTSGGKTYVIDPMISQGSAGDANVYETGDAYSDSVKVVQDSTDGLYWRKATDCTTSGKEISLSGSTAPANVRAGGLCKLDGMIYRIESVSGSKVYVNKDLPTFSGSSKVDAYFAIAQVIDNTVKEVGVTTTYDDSDNSIDNDDGDKMVDYYLSTNAQWVCSVNSKNIKDGSVKINFVAFDQAGNLKKVSYDGLVSNNRPRIAGVSFATDRNGNDIISTDEYVKTYSGLFATNGLHKISGVTVNGQRPNGNKVYKLAVPNNGSDYETLSGDSVMTIKGLTHIVPEIVGGNNGVGYTYAVKNTTDADFAENSDSDYVSLNTNHGGDESVRDTSTTTIELTAAQLMSMISADAEKDFRFTIWDSTDGTTPGTDSNSSELLLRMNVALYDGVEPTVKITPFYWNAAGDGNNSVYYKDETIDEEKQSVIKGHIELEDELPNEFTDGGTGVNDRDPKVSGIIYLEGQAKDNVMINELSLYFPTLAETASPTFGKELVKFAQRTAGVISKVSGLSLETQGVEVVDIQDSYDDSEYNIVKFKLAIDTSKIKNVADSDIEIQIQAKDRGDAAKTASTVKSSSLEKNDTTENSPLYQVDVVPYITKLYTGISETAGEEFARSANGKYVVRGHYRTYSSEYKMWTDDMTETVRLYGFNLKDGTGAVKIGSSTIDLSAGDTDDNGHYYYTFDVGKNTVSGDLSVTVNSLESLNNKNADPEFASDTDNSVKAVEYNCQANGITNNRLNDDVSLYVWDIHGFGTFYDTNITSPMMKMDKAGSYYMSYGYGVPSMYVNKNGTTRRIDGSYNKFHNTNVQFDDNGNLYAVATNTDRINDSSARFVFYTPYSSTTKNQMPAENNGTNGEYQNSSDSKRHLEQVYNGKTGVYDINRVKNPKLTSYTNGATTYIGMAYFDYNNDINPVKARFGTRNGKTISGGIKGSTNGGKGQSNDPTKTDSSYMNYHIVASDNTTFKGGQYTAVGIVSASLAGTTNNVGVVAWYDASVRRVCYSWNDDLDNAVVGGAWQTNARYLDGKYTGWYVDLAVDDKGGIHIAYYNSAKGDLKYVYLSKYNATPTEAVTVDSYLSVGTNITVNTRLENGEYVPYIYYYNASANQTPNSIKVAWRYDMANLRDGASNDKFTGAWECMTIPTENIPVDATVCGGVPTSGTYSKTVVLGYMSDQFYEKAYIKK